MDPLSFDTIAAIATPRGHGGVAIVRVSGPEAVPLVGTLMPGETDLAAAPSHTVHHAWLRDAGGAALDETLVTVMRAPRTFTGEDVVEIGVHGGSVVAQRVLDAVLAAGARLADHGEFTKRAFLHGRIDLSQAEAVSDLVAARTTRAADSALAALAGRLAARTRRVEDTLLDLLARLELNLDFHEDVQAVDREAVAAGLRGAIDELAALRDRAAWGRRLRDGAIVVLTGEPNVGKSSLFNALLEDDRALVSEAPGTTRDWLEAWIDVEGVPVRLVDTAGLREASSDVEAEGVRRARKLREDADLCVHVVDVSAGIPVAAGASTTRPPRRAPRPPAGPATDGAGAEAGAAGIVVGNKCDLLAGAANGNGEDGDPRAGAASGDDAAGDPRACGVDLLVSARTGDGVAELRGVLGDRLGGGAARPEAEEATPSERHADAIRRALEALERSDAAWRDGATEEWIAGEVRDAAEALGEISGRTVSEAVLDRIFSRFCIGK